MFVTVSSGQMFASTRCLVEVGNLLCHLLALTVCKHDGSLSLPPLKLVTILTAYLCTLWKFLLGGNSLI